MLGGQSTKPVLQYGTGQLLNSNVKGENDEFLLKDFFG